MATLSCRNTSRLLISEPQEGAHADALKSLKHGVSRRLIDGANHFWQKRYYDFNVQLPHSSQHKA
jgi:hypothetical protein